MAVFLDRQSSGKAAKKEFSLAFLHASLYRRRHCDARSGKSRYMETSGIVTQQLRIASAARERQAQPRVSAKAGQGLRPGAGSLPFSFNG
ncbi:hypothetical protein [Pseudoduganella violaceinigra]|uniref:hypothetical protein n=1 Tax=Pseudoduganella violaceinigra TaxID=246602 RepID=UPI000687FC35|nr:hypothetical protein [Pseudoduganella violaceinigra]